MNYIYIDGDNIGLKIEQSFLNNDELELHKINSKIIDIIKSITDYLNSTNHNIIFSGADGIICKNENLDTLSIIKAIRSFSPEITFSIGIGNSLSDSYIALRYAKSLSKDVAVSLFNSKYEIIK